VKTSELNEKSVEELAGLEKSVTRELWQARFSNHSNQLDDTDKVRRMRRDVARVKTIITQKTRENK
jgi:large subunit ribosomal protein L29